MKKLSLIFIITLVLVLVALQPAMAVKLIRLGHDSSIEAPIHKGFELFKELVEFKMDDYKVEIFPNEQLGSEEEMVELLKLGSIEGVWGSRFESMGIQFYTLGLPFIFKDYDHVNRVLNSYITDYLEDFAEDHYLKVVGWSHAGFRQITNNSRPIKSPADIKGLKMRTPPLENILQTMQVLGASPTTIPFGEVYMSLRTGVVDGQENPYNQISNSKLYEVQKYCSEVNYIYLPVLFCFGLDWWNSLPMKDQEIIDEAAKIAAKFANDLTETTDKAYKQIAIEHGMEIYEPTDEERQAFIDMVQPVYDFFIKNGSTTPLLIELIQNS